MEPLKLEDCANDVCPWSGKLVSESGLMVYHGRVVGFGDAGYRDRFLAAIVALETALAPTATARTN